MKKVIRGKRTLQLSYLAGFIDGEGSIFITKINNKKSGNVWYRTTVACANSDRRPIDMLREWTNAKAFFYRPGKKATYKPSWQWLATGNTALKFLKDIEPYLIVKKKQAQVAIEFQEWRNTLGNTGKKRLKKEIVICEEKRQIIKKLNQMYSQPQRLNKETPKGDVIV